MSTPHLAALVTDTSQSKRNHNNDSICEALIPKKVPLVQRHETHQKVRRPFIMGSYLDLSHIETHSTCVVTSLLSFHNETANIYTHLIPGILIFIYLITQWHNICTFLWIDWNNMCIEPDFTNLYGLFVLWHTRSFILHCCILSLFIMCFLSSYYHCGRCCDPNLHDYYLSIDWSGALLLIFCSFLSCIYVGFECYPVIQYTYLLLFVLTPMFVLTAMFFIWPKKTSFKCKAITLAMFGGFGAVVIPFHWLFVLATEDEYSIFFIVSVKFFLLYGFGFICFILRLPERISPGLFDKVGNSHNIWHLCIVIASWTWWKGLVQVAENRMHC